MELDPRDQDSTAIYRLMSTAIVPRPIGWVSSQSLDGHHNLAPYSYFNAVSSKPPVIAFSAGSTDAGLKDTPKNILESEEFVWNLVTEDLIEEMDKTSSSLAHGESEFDFAEVDQTASVKVKPPRVADAAICFECELYDSMSVYDNTVLLGDVVHIYVCDDVLKHGEIDARKINAVGRLGGPFYTAIDMMDFERKY